MLPFSARISLERDMYPLFGCHCVNQLAMTRRGADDAEINEEKMKHTSPLIKGGHTIVFNLVFWI